MRLKYLYLFLAVGFVVFAVGVRMKTRPELVDYSAEFGFPFLIDGRIRVTKADDWGMGYTVRPGDFVLWVELGNRAPALGDLILYEDPTGRSVVRRIVGIENGGFRTKGDNLPEPDDYLVRKPLGVVIGVVYSTNKGS